MTQFWCSYCEQVSVSGDHECEPKGVEEFLGWFRAQYRDHGPRAWRDLVCAWAGASLDQLDDAYREGAQQVDTYLRYLQDVTGEVVCDTQQYPPVYYPRGMEAERKTHQGLQQHLDAAVKLATKRGYGKVRI